MKPLYGEIRSADAIVLGSPIYMGYVTGLMKVFLDRWYAFVRVPDPVQLPKGKRILLAFPYRRPDKEIFNYVGKQIGQVMKYLFEARTESMMVEGVQDKGDVLKRLEVMEQAFQAGRKMTLPAE